VGTTVGTDGRVTDVGNAVSSDRYRITPLDGIRALAVLAVILYHATGWAQGGYFGVDVFFVLSGFLITTLLLVEWRGTGGVALRSFWARRARRLLPALFLMLAVVGVVAVALPQVLGSPDLVGDTVATVFYVANWHLMAAGTSYFDTVATPSPLTHTWSLAIEEQFYLVWPLVVLALVGGFRRHRSAPDRGGATRKLVLVAGVAAAGAVASAVLMAVLTPVGTLSVNRAYYGSDTRAQSILVGAALAAVGLAWGPVRTVWGRRLLGVAGLVGAVVVVVMWVRVPETSALTFHGGFALLSVAAAGVIACVTLVPGHPLARVLSLPPLPYLGRISYGMYLWYLPVLLVMTSGRTHLDGLSLLAARLAVIVAIAAASYHLVEVPVRRGALRGWRSWVAVPVAALCVTLVPVFVPSLAGTLPAADAAVGTPGPAPAGLAGSPRTAHPVRILLVGDSMAGSLGVGLSTVAGLYGAEVVNEGAPGCSLTEGTEVRVLWYTVAPGPPCSARDPGAVLADYRSLVQRFDPDVVVYLARADTFDTLLDGRWQHVGQPAFDRWASSRFARAIGVLGAGGARVVLLTSPYYDSGEQGDGQPWPENDPVRVAAVNRLLVRVARVDPGVASVIPLGSLLSPAGRFSSRVDGVPVRCTDGVHITVTGGRFIGDHLLPALVALGRAHAGAPDQARRVPVPPTAAPGWYTSLPCGT